MGSNCGNQGEEGANQAEYIGSLVAFGTAKNPVPRAVVPMERAVGGRRWRHPTEFLTFCISQDLEPLSTSLTEHGLAL